MRIKELDEKYVAHTYNRYPIVLTRGQGSKVWDDAGREYIDCIMGIGACILGHCPSVIVRALEKQSRKLVHCSNLFYIEEQAELAERIASITPNGLDKSFFCNSGGEAVEAALKLARKHTHKKEFIVMKNSFHGRTLGALSGTWLEKYRKPFEPLVPGFKFIDYNSIDAAREAITSDTAAVMLEPIQGEGGINVSSKDYLKELRELCDEKDVLLVFDEVQTFARTGSFFASQTLSVTPDVLTVAKGVAGGIPMGILVAREDVMNSFEPSDHASTFGGNPLASSVSIAVIDYLKKEKLPEKAGETGSKLIKELRRISESVRDVRGKGFMIGIEAESKERAESVMLKARENGLLVNVTHEKIVRLLPALTMSNTELNETKEILSKLFLTD